MNKLQAGLAAAALAATSWGSAQAEEYVTGYAGLFDVVQQENEAFQFGAEYRFAPNSYGLLPIFGVFGTTDGSVYGYGGLNWEIALIDQELYLIPNFAVGVYSDGDGRDLGGPVEFRSGIEIDYQFPNTHRVGVAFNHMSNAGIYRRNPGTEALMINYSLPVGAALR